MRRRVGRCAWRSKESSRFFGALLSACRRPFASMLRTRVTARRVERGWPPAAASRRGRLRLGRLRPQPRARPRRGWLSCSRWLPGACVRRLLGAALASEACLRSSSLSWSRDGASSTKAKRSASATSSCWRPRTRRRFGPPGAGRVRGGRAVLQLDERDALRHLLVDQREELVLDLAAARDLVEEHGLGLPDRGRRLEVDEAAVLRHGVAEGRRSSGSRRCSGGRRGREPRRGARAAASWPSREARRAGAGTRWRAPRGSRARARPNRRCRGRAGSWFGLGRLYLENTPEARGFRAGHFVAPDGPLQAFGATSPGPAASFASSGPEGTLGCRPGCRGLSSRRPSPDVDYSLQQEGVRRGPSQQIRVRPPVPYQAAT